jgi:serine/threonine-protein kinase HipA
MMNLLDIQYCPSTLQPGYSTYSPLAQQALFGNRSKKVSHILPFGPPGKNPELTREYNEKRKLISISGVQEKYSLALHKNALQLTASKGTHILKPIPAERLELVEDMPANEHVTMQMARQIFKIKTASCGLIFFDDGSPAYITRRFDYKGDGTKFQVEDFATLLDKSPEREGDDYKYSASYLDIATLILQHVPASKVELLHFFRLVVFNYLIANGDAHLKNFALMESEQGDYLLAPAYDLMNTAIHIDDYSLALQDGLYKGDRQEAAYNNFGTYTKQSFLAFAQKATIPESLANQVLDDFISLTIKAIEMVERSFLSEEAKKRYVNIIGERYQRLKLK